MYRDYNVDEADFLWLIEEEKRGVIVGVALDKFWDMLVSSGTCTENSLNLLTGVNGYSYETLCDALYYFTGNNSIIQWAYDFGIDYSNLEDEENEKD